MAGVTPENHREQVESIIAKVVRPLPEIEVEHAKRRGARALRSAAIASAREVKDALTPGRRNALYATSAALVSGGGARALEFFYGVPRTLTIPAVEAIRFATGSVQLDAEKKALQNSDEPEITERESRGFIREQEDLTLSGELRVALDLWFQEKNNPDLVKNKQGLERLFPDNPKMLVYARKKLAHIYDVFNAELQRQHKGFRGDEGSDIFLGNAEHPIISTRAVQSTRKINREENEFFAGKEKKWIKNRRLFGEGNPLHTTILESLRQEKNEDLRLAVLQGTETAVSNFLLDQVDKNHRRIIANRVSQVFGGLQVAFAGAAAAIFYGGAHEALPISVIAGAALAAAIGITQLAWIVPAAVMTLLVLGAGFSIGASVMRIFEKNHVIKGAKEDKKKLNLAAENILRRIDLAMEPIAATVDKA